MTNPAPNPAPRLARFMLLLGFALVALVATHLVERAGARAAGIEVTSQAHENRFPTSMYFSLQARSDAPIDEAILYYSVTGGRGSGTNTNRGVPEDLQPSTEISTSVTIETGNRRYLPPGTGVTYWWELKDSAGNRLKTEPTSFNYDDTRFQWSSIEKDRITLYWYSGSRQQAEQILDAAVQSVQRLAREADVHFDHPMKIWVYNSKAEMDPALPQSSPSYQERTVTLGVRLSPEVMALLGNHSEVIETVAHEVSHMVIHQAIENPFAQLPAWLDEGLAMYAQGELPPGHQRVLEEAKRRSELMSVRSLTSYVGDPSKVNLFYAQSYSFVDYLIKTYGREKMNQLLQVYKRGTTNNAALEEVYGFDVEGLDERWRAWFGAPPRPAGSGAATSSTPQPVATLPLMTLPPSTQPTAPAVGGSPAAVGASVAETPVATTAPLAAPTVAPTVAVAAERTGSSPLPFLALGLGGLVALVVVAGIIFTIARRAGRPA